MASEMPERIWVGRAEAIDGLLMFAEEGKGNEYIRADLAVLATTHQRTLEALREAEKAFSRIVDGREVRDQMAPETTRVESLPRDEIEAICEAALARIKEATDAG